MTCKRIAADSSERDGDTCTRRTSNERTNYKKRWQPLALMNLHQDGIVLHCLTSSRRRLLHWINRLTCNNDPSEKNGALCVCLSPSGTLTFRLIRVLLMSAMPLPYQIAVIYSGQTFCASQVLQDRTGLDLGFYVIFMLIRNLVDMWFWNACNLVPPSSTWDSSRVQKTELSSAYVLRINTHALFKNQLMINICVKKITH